MPRVCTVCAHDDRREIDRLIVQNKPYYEIARRFGLGDDPVKRHALSHVLKAVRDSEAARAARDAFDVVQELQNTYDALTERLAGCDGDNAFAALTNARLKTIQMAHDFGVDLPAASVRYTVRLEMNP